MIQWQTSQCAASMRSWWRFRFYSKNYHHFKLKKISKFHFKFDVLSWLCYLVSKIMHCCPPGLYHPSTSLSLSGIVSLISLAILSYDRYSTLTVYNKRGLDYRRPLLAVGGSWLYSLLWTVPPLLGWSSYGIEGAGTSCSVSWTANTAQSHAYIICLFIFCLGLPVLVMIYCYSRLLWAVKQVESHQVLVCVSLTIHSEFLLRVGRQRTCCLDWSSTVWVLNTAHKFGVFFTKNSITVIYNWMMFGFKVQRVLICHSSSLTLCSATSPSI